ncbi:BTAD domain-containing putative transcriptional regulator [Nonomuraea sp. NPDC049709]|uniref:BTAD domain-containing putative transcriptional regulator n=1 Tax=Nonomuraea sp. NPDC049709 TaxID=3154736 RepID=UPI003447921C
MVTFGVLGPLTAENERGPVHLKGPRHRAVLARLLVAKGRVVPVSWLIGDLWEDPPEGALGAVQTFVGALRKALEPSRPPRTPSRLLVTSPPGYALRAEAVDASRFESAVAASARLLAGGAAGEARAVLDEALGWWRGPAYAEFAEQDWARGEAARLDELRLLAVERRAEAALASGLAAESVPDLEAHVSGHPLREDGWRLLALALYRTGRQGDALATLRRARQTLLVELGVDPGEGLRRLESDILTHASHLSAPGSPSPDHLFVRPGDGTEEPATDAGTGRGGESGPGVRGGESGPGVRGGESGPGVRGGESGPGVRGGESGGPDAAEGELGWAGHPFVGRVAELAELEGVAAEVTAAGRARLALLSGAAGAGKTALARALARRLEARGWSTAWGASPELGGAPSAWPWTQMREHLTASADADALAPAPADGPAPDGGQASAGGPAPTGEPALTGGSARTDAPAAPVDDRLAARFRRHRAIASYLAATAAEQGPILLVLDDLHWADEETLALLTTLATGLGAAPVLIVATYRSTEISAGLGEALGRVARAEPARIYLGGLTEPQVGELVRAITGREVPDADARTIHARSAGNPFFVRELTRVWESEGDAALHTVPAGVRDVIRHRLAALTDAARTHLRQAAVLGQEVDLDVLISLSGDTNGGEERVLESAESALIAGFLVEQDADRLRFAHALVHETLYDDIPRARRARWHARVAGILERARPGDVETIAHHCLRAEGRAGAARTAHYTRAAAERAERRFAPHEAARLWRETLTALDRADDGRLPGGGVDGSPGRAVDDRLEGGGVDGSARWAVDGRLADGGVDGSSRRSGGGVEGGSGWAGGGPGRLEAVMGLVRALAVTGELDESRRYRAEAVGAAEALGDPVLTAAVIGSFDVPAIWTSNDDPALSAGLVAAAERTLAALPPGHESERARLLITIAMERRADAGRRGDQAAREAEAIARRLGDRTLLAYALNGRYMQTFHRAGLAPERAAIGEELLGLATHDSLVTFEVLGHLILLQARAALADLGAADRHAAAADRLAARYDLPLVGVFTTWYAALRLAVTGGPEDAARSAYRAAAARLSGTGMAGVEEGMLPLALLCLGGGDAGSVPQEADWGPYERWARPLVLLARGRRDEALAAARTVPDSPRDLLFEARTCLHALAAIEAADRPTMERLYDRLLPAEGELAGAGSGLVSLGPVALYLGRLAAALGRRSRAAGHFRNAEAMRAGVR